MPFLFENLTVYQKAITFSVAVSKLTDTFPRGNYYLADQLNRASLSIPANLAEGNGRWHPNDRRQFFWIARGSALECVPIIEVGFQKGLITGEAYKQFRNDLDEIGKMITGLIKGMDKRI
jgi:four helix bundle protein